LLACSPFGAAEVIMLTHGFTRDTLAGLVRAGLATTAQRETVKTDVQSVGRVRITEAGRRVIDRLTARRPSPRLP
jgi:hypothetical protein